MSSSKVLTKSADLGILCRVGVTRDRGMISGRHIIGFDMALSMQSCLLHGLLGEWSAESRKVEGT